MAHGQLRNGLGGSLRGVLDGDAVGLCILHIDVVHADAAADDELELAAPGFVNVVGTDLRLRADDDRVKLPQGCTQFFGGIELLHDLMTGLAQLRHGGLVHSVGNENTHDIDLLISFCVVFL